ncbi:MAG TPA: hypothetical protein VN041_18365 [Microbacterium sp.]|nr:hypothetical protein [Microbacterium sp.]
MAVENDEILAPAYAQYRDFDGSVTADTHGGGTLELANKIGLDPDRFWIVGIDVWGADLETARLNVIAIDREATGIADYASLAAHHENSGPIPVTRFLVHNISPIEVLKVGLKRLNFQLLSRSLPEGASLNVTLDDDLNYDAD